MKKVLVIEDNRDNFGLIRFALERAGYQVEAAETGSDGVSRALQSHPDLIIVDINLPDFDGYEVTRRIREGAPGRDVPIVAITSHAMLGDREKTLAAGCTAYFEKPIDPITIVEDMERAIASFRAAHAPGGRP
ncbi:response regulator [Geomonas silvestris]|uniref:Response regulator n=1 Tax=Geomonas silvestris TaxID=2740184 RepID=A0A6V8MHS9_9BACT|nr:response regulator [Geomonas silvestris]GFO59209.1 response regulator [Geomonas silvestris]